MQFDESHETDPHVVGTGLNGRITYKDVAEMLLRLEETLTKGQARIEVKIDTYIAAHVQQHSTETDKFNEHTKVSAVMGERGKTIWDEVSTLKNQVFSMSSQIDDLKEWRAEIRGMINLIKFALGASVLGTLISIITFINEFNKV